MTIDSASFDTSMKQMLSFGPEWIKSLVESPFKAYATYSREALAVAARSIQTQADYFKKLSECQGPAEVLSCQSEFAQKGLSLYVQEGQHLFDIVRSNYPTPAATT